MPWVGVVVEPVLDQFAAAAVEAVQHLARACPLGAWLVALTDDDGGWTPVAAVDRCYGLALGTSLSWQDTLCSRMVLGLGPHVSARVESSAVYAAAPIGLDLPLGAYVGTALLRPDGSVLGTLCGLDPEPQPESLHDVLPLVTVLAGVLSRLHAAEVQAAADRQRAAAAEVEAVRCPLTGALNRRGWLQQLEALVGHVDRSAEDLALLSLDLDDLKRTNDAHGHAAGDALLCRTVEVLTTALRPADLLARLGGDELGVAGVVSGPGGLDQLLRRVRETLAGAGLRVSSGGALRPPGTPVPAVWQEADARMYAEKQRRRSAAGGATPPPR